MTESRPRRGVRLFRGPIGVRSTPRLVTTKASGRVTQAIVSATEPIRAFGLDPHPEAPRARSCGAGARTVNRVRAAVRELHLHRHVAGAAAGEQAHAHVDRQAPARAARSRARPRPARPRPRARPACAGASPRGGAPAAARRGRSRARRSRARGRSRRPRTDRPGANSAAQNIDASRHVEAHLADAARVAHVEQAQAGLVEARRHQPVAVVEVVGRAGHPQPVVALHSEAVQRPRRAGR